MDWSRWLNFLGFQSVWWVCVLGAAAGHPFWGPCAAGVFLSLDLTLRPDGRRQIGLIMRAAALGFVLDSGLSGMGFFTFRSNAPGDWLSPLWMVALWMVFAATLRSSLGWLLGRPWLAALLGGVGGPLSYLAGARLGAINLRGLWVLAVVGAVWALVTPLLAHWAAKLDRIPDPV